MKSREMMLMVALVLSLAVAAPVLAADAQGSGDGGFSEVQRVKWDSLATLIRGVGKSKSQTEQAKDLKIAVAMTKEIQLQAGIPGTGHRFRPKSLAPLFCHRPS